MYDRKCIVIIEFAYIKQTLSYAAVFVNPLESLHECINGCIKCDLIFVKITGNRQSYLTNNSMFRCHILTESH